MRSTKEEAKNLVALDRETVKQMLSLYRAIQVARNTYTSGTTAYKLQVELISQTADARNVKSAFERAAEEADLEV